VELMQADVASLDLPDASFDTANVANAIHCFPDVDAGLRELHRVLKPGGTLATNVLLYPQGMQPFRWIAEKIDAWGMKKGILYTPYRRDDIRARIERTVPSTPSSPNALDCRCSRASAPSSSAARDASRADRHASAMHAPATTTPPAASGHIGTPAHASPTTAPAVAHGPATSA